MYIDEGEPGPTLGDEFVYTNAGETARLGSSRDYGSCTFHETNDGEPPFVLACTSTAVLQGGSLTFQGATELDPATGQPVGGESEWAITGGTGVFVGAEGEATFTLVPAAEGRPERTEGKLRLRLG